MVAENWYFLNTLFLNLLHSVAAFLMPRLITINKATCAIDVRSCQLREIRALTGVSDICVS